MEGCCTCSVSNTPHPSSTHQAAIKPVSNQLQYFKKKSEKCQSASWADASRINCQVNGYVVMIRRLSTLHSTHTCINCMARNTGKIQIQRECANPGNFTDASQTGDQHSTRSPKWDMSLGKPVRVSNPLQALQRLSPTQGSIFLLSMNRESLVYPSCCWLKRKDKRNTKEDATTLPPVQKFLYSPRHTQHINCMTRNMQISSQLWKNMLMSPKQETSTAAGHTNKASHCASQWEWIFPFGDYNIGMHIRKLNG